MWRNCLPVPTPFGKLRLPSLEVVGQFSFYMRIFEFIQHYIVCEILMKSIWTIRYEKSILLLEHSPGTRKLWSIVVVGASIIYLSLNKFVNRVIVPVKGAETFGSSSQQVYTLWHWCRSLAKYESLSSITKYNKSKVREKLGQWKILHFF